MVLGWVDVDDLLVERDCAAPLSQQVVSCLHHLPVCFFGFQLPPPPKKINIETKNDGLEDDFPNFQGYILRFHVNLLIFWGVHNSWSVFSFFFSTVPREIMGLLIGD